ncbi:uncharacterized protein LOC126674823 [Mercurialis annua]|uniref:uncharacterized protein LOC126674823 n=1 Tax=Mercurialis annua TaxID=3986 RepID=UPI00215FB27D|nr:uncharacterized protein LOC126674823 [Mercurialis annua]
MNSDLSKDKKSKWVILRRASLILSSVLNPTKKSLPKDVHHSKILKRIEYGETNGDNKKSSESVKRRVQIEKDEQKKKNKSVTRFFHKKSYSFNCMGGGNVKKFDVNSNFSAGLNSFTGQNSSNSDGRIGDIMARSLPRVPSRIMTTRQRLKMAHSLTKMGSSRRRSIRDDGDGDGDENASLIRCEGLRNSEGRDGGIELCKKRILMGGKCRPLSHSGTLEYDGDGFLLPDIISDLH